MESENLNTELTTLQQMIEENANLKTQVCKNTKLLSDLINQELIALNIESEQI